MKFTRHFKFDGKLYAFHKGQLYRLPQKIGSRHFRLLKCKPWKDGFYLGSKRLSKGQIDTTLSLIAYGVYYSESRKPAQEKNYVEVINETPDR